MSTKDEKNNNKTDASQRNGSLNWYVLHVYSSCEQIVIEYLRKYIQEGGFEKSFGEILVPTEKVVSLRGADKKKVKSDRKFFPGYVLIEMEMNDATWHLVNRVPKVLGFIGGEKPAPVAQREVDAVLDRLSAEGEGKVKPKVLFEPGELVRVIEGPFSDFNGVVEDVNYEKSRLRVSVYILGRATPVELEFTQVEKTA
jgi:transcriptional antiterminator NusG